MRYFAGISKNLDQLHQAAPGTACEAGRGTAGMCSLYAAPPTVVSTFILYILLLIFTCFFSLILFFFPFIYLILFRIFKP